MLGESRVLGSIPRFSAIYARATPPGHSRAGSRTGQAPVSEAGDFVSNGGSTPLLRTLLRGRAAIGRQRGLRSHGASCPIAGSMPVVHTIDPGCTAGRSLASKTDVAVFDSLGARHLTEDLRAGCSSRIANPRGPRVGGFEPLVFRHPGHRVGPWGPATLKTSRFQFDSGGVHHSRPLGDAPSWSCCRRRCPVLVPKTSGLHRPGG